MPPWINQLIDSWFCRKNSSSPLAEEHRLALVSIGAQKESRCRNQADSSQTNRRDNARKQSAGVARSSFLTRGRAWVRGAAHPGHCETGGRKYLDTPLLFRHEGGALGCPAGLPTGKFTAPERTNPRSEGVRGHFENSWETFKKTPHLITVLLELVVRAHREPVARAAFRQLYKYWNAELERVLTGLAKKGRVRSDLDPRLAAFVMTSTIMGASIQLGVNPKAFDFRQLAQEVERWTV